EEILNALARTPDLLVASRTSSFAFKNSEEPVADIANELNVAHVLEGSVRRAGDAIRVTVQLIRASDGFHLWSENIDGSADDIIDIQEKVASEIARSLETAMDPAELEKMMDVGTRSVRAYELYLQGIALQDEIIRTGDMRLIPELLEKMDAALEEDPGFSDVHAYQAFFWKGAASFNWKVGRDLPLTYKERQQRALESFENASRNARNAAERARYEYQITILRGNWREGLEILKAVEPERPQDFDMCADIAETHDWLGEREAAVAQVKRCLEIGKDNPSVDLGAMTDLAWQFGELAWVEELFAESPGNTTSDVVEAYQFQRLLLWVGDIEGAAQQLLLIENAAPDFSNLPKLRQACAESRLDDAERFYRQLINDRESNFAVGDRWLAHDLMGRPEQAYPEMHEYATAEKAATFADFLVYPQFDPTLFPELMKLIRRNNGTVIPPVAVPFACHARGEYPADLEGKAS
ncbi:MAG: hypothetical protein R3217_10470, partial [Gammaproteobacteria bacterium]|nr:hypothetical protein [Gammaproteobacteria bacterium]